MKLIPFSEVQIGQKFQFESVSFPLSGMASGPWIKKTKRIYERISDGMRCQVGTVKTKCFLVD